MSTTPRDYREHAAVASADMATMLDNHPDAFDCLIFKAIPGSEENVAADVTDLAGSLESTTRAIDYADPMPSRCMIVPDEGLRLAALSNGTDADYWSEEQPLAVVLKEQDVPKQSVIRWREFSEDPDGEPRTVTMYVLRSEPFGKSPIAGMKHFCIPFQAAGEIGG